MKVLSADFTAGALMPDKFGAKGEGVSPQLSWSGAPANAKSFALIVEDPDAPGPAPFIHWVLFNIPPNVDHLDQGVTPTLAVSGQNSGGQTGYFPPKPPSGTHHYIFRVYALDSMLDLSNGADEAQVVTAMKNHTLAEGEITGLYAH
jgi:hypothetical protein